MRLNECEQVKKTLKEHLGINLTIVDGSELFLGRLAGVLEPEAKRKIIGATCELSQKALHGASVLTQSSHRSLRDRSTQVSLYTTKSLAKSCRVLRENVCFRIEKEAENTARAGKVEWFLQGTLYGQLFRFIDSLARLN